MPQEKDTLARTETISNTASTMATQIALRVLEQYYNNYYEKGYSDGKYWILKEGDTGEEDDNPHNLEHPTSKGTHTYQIYERTPDNSISENDDTLEPFQTLTFEDGILVEAVTASAVDTSSYYRYDLATDTVEVGYYDPKGNKITDLSYIPENSFMGRITRDEANITEKAAINLTNLFINYGIATQDDGSIHLQPKETRLGDYTQLYSPDDDIICQRQIPLKDLMEHFIRPQGGFRINSDEKAIPTPLVDTSGFPEIVTDYRVPNRYIQLDPRSPDRRFYGSAHLLKGEKPQWLTFCSFKTKEGGIAARLFKITVDPTQATTEESDGRTRIIYTFIVDGKPIPIEAGKTKQLADNFAVNLNISTMLKEIMKKYYTETYL